MAARGDWGINVISGVVSVLCGDEVEAAYGLSTVWLWLWADSEGGPGGQPLRQRCDVMYTGRQRCAELNEQNTQLMY